MEDFLIEPVMLGNTPLLDLRGLLEMLARFVLNIVAVGIVVRCFYYPKSLRRDYYFTFMLISVSIFMLVYYMEGAKLKVGAALGLFAIFGIIRYRTEAVPIREMTYLFFLVALSVVNGMAEKMSLLELLIPNLIFIGVAWLFESNRMVRHVSSKIICYDKVGLIVPERRVELIADLEQRTGLKILRLEIGAIDFLRDSTLIKIYYESETGRANSMEHVERMPKTFEG